MRLIFLVFLFSLSLWGGKLNWASSYEKAQQQALKENKGILAIITKKSCRWCRKLEETTLQDDAVVARIHSKFVPVHLTRYRDKYPSSLMAKSVPMNYFLFSDGTPIMRGVMGYWSTEDYLSIMDDVDRYIRKYEKKNKEQKMKEAKK